MENCPRPIHSWSLVMNKKSGSLHWTTVLRNGRWVWKLRGEKQRKEMEGERREWVEGGVCREMEKDRSFQIIFSYFKNQPFCLK